MKDPEVLVTPPEGQSWSEFFNKNKALDLPELNSEKFSIEKREEDDMVIRAFVYPKFMEIMPQFRNRYDFLGYTLSPPIPRGDRTNQSGAIMLYDRVENRDVWFHIPLNYLENILGIDYPND